MKTTAHTLALSYATGKTTPVAVLDELYQNIDQAPHAFISLSKELAYSQAEASSRRWQLGVPLSVFDGVPMAYKDLFDIKGVITTAGAKLRKNAPPAASDAAAVARLHQMGLVAVGKTNLSEFAYSGLGLNPHFGTPPNVVNDKHIAGGSSSGSATVVGSGLAPLAMGTDTAGSIRIPSSFNGIVGFRASRHRYDKTGVFPLADSLDTIGPLARSSLDCLLIDKLLMGNPSGEFLQMGEVHRFIDKLNLPTLIYDNAIVSLADDEVQACFYRWVDRLTSLGIVVRERTVRAVHETLDCINTLWLGSAEAYALHECLLASPQADELDRRVKKRLLLAKDIKASTQIRLYQTRQRLHKELAYELGKQMFIMPTVAHTAPKLAPLEADDEYFFDVNAKTLKLTMIGSFLDMPAISLPIGTDGQGLPIGALISGADGCDDVVLQASCLIEKLLG